MGNKTLGPMLLALGVLLVLVSAAADRLGLGGAPGFGWKQLAGLAVGVLIAAVGMVKLRSR